MYKTEWLEEDRQRVMNMERWYILDGRHRPDHPQHGSILVYRKKQMTSTALTELCDCPHCKELRRQQARHGKWQELLLHINKNNEKGRDSS